MAPSEIQALKRRTRRDYPYHLEYRTRWSVLPNFAVLHMYELYCTDIHVSCLMNCQCAPYTHIHQYLLGGT